jgi:hypothetical protein
MRQNRTLCVLEVHKIGGRWLLNSPLRRCQIVDCLDWSTLKRAARLITEALLNESGETGF